ncbi:MAG: hypothetical protein ACKO23_11420, partial [Gemmataceae bacterium]
MSLEEGSKPGLQWKSGSPTMAEQFNVKARAETEAMGFAELDQPGRICPEFLHPGSLGHQHDLFFGEGGEIGKQIEDFFHVLRGFDHELELAIVVLHKGFQNVKLQSQLIVFLGPLATLAFKRNGITQLGTQTDEIAL